MTKGLRDVLHCDPIAVIEIDALAHVLREATELHQQGRLDEAERLYSRVLEQNPRQFDALNRMAIVALQRGFDGDLSAE